MLAGAIGWGQTRTMPVSPVSPMSPVQPTSPVQPGTPVQPSSPVQPLSPVRPFTPIQSGVATNGWPVNPIGLTNQFGANTGQATTPMSLGDTAGGLVNLQAGIEQILPALNDLVGQSGQATVNQRQLANGAIVSAVGANAFAMDRLTFQQLRVLQTDLQQALPLLQALNGTLNSASGPFTNRFLAFPNAAGPIAPTGR